MIARETRPKKWDSILQLGASATVFQTTRWADFMWEYVKAEPIYVTAGENGKVRGMLLLFKEGLKNRSFFEEPLAFATVPLLRKTLPVISWHYGPVVLDEAMEKKVFDSILEKVDEIAKCRRAYAASGAIPPMHGGEEQERIRGYFESHGYSAKKWGTFLVDLAPDADTLWANLKKTGRKGVRRCEEQGISVELAKDSDLKDVYNVLVEEGKRSGRKVYSFANLSVMWKHLRKNGSMETFMAKQGKLLLGTLAVLHFNGVITEMAAARSNYAVESNIYTGDTIKWAIIKWGHEKRHRIYDLTGVNPDPADSKEQGIYQFKNKWGGELVEYYVYGKRYSTKRAAALRALRKIKP
jgi:hypothetical protein